MRNSKQRDLILNIINNAYTHPTAEEVYYKAREEISNISLGTVYRNLDTLTKNGDIRRINHAHFVCNNCSVILDIPREFLQNLNEISGNKVHSYDIIFKGICKNCLNKGRK